MKVLGRSLNIVRILLFLTAWLTGNSVGAAELSVSTIEKISIPTPIEWQAGQDSDKQLAGFFRSEQNCTWKKASVQVDLKGNVHSRFQQFVNGIPVKGAVVILHEFTTQKVFITGVFIRISGNSIAQFNLVNSEKEIVGRYLQAEDELNSEMPGGFEWQLNPDNKTAKLVFVLNYFPQNSLAPLTLIIDAETKHKISDFHSACFADVTGVAVTTYEGTRNISCFADSGQYYLKTTLKGNGIETKNLNHNLNYQHITEFTDTDNFWQQGAVVDENYAADAHFCAEQYYDFLNIKFNRNSLDNDGYRLMSYLNYGTGLANAFWNGQAVVYGSGNATTSPLTTLDITGHEFTHGLIQKTAGLAYNGEPGTINEALSDIFGTALEFYTNPLQANWLIGAQTGTPLRSFSDPNAYGQPAAYHGNSWYYGTGDQGGVHINSGFINHWFYILTNGAQGTNEFGTSYNVNGIGMISSLNLVYTALTSYLVSNSGYEEFYVSSLQSTIDLYGNCSPEYQAVVEAWKAVGYGSSSSIPQISLNGNAAICNGDSVFIGVRYLPGESYEWFQNGLSVYTGNVSGKYVKDPGTWMIKVNHCGQISGSDSIVLSQLAIVPVSTVNVESCTGNPVVLQGYPAGGVFSISNPYSGNSTTFDYYFTDGNGCTTTAAGTVLMHESPVVSIFTSAAQLPVNSEPLLLESNVLGTFTGNGVSGNYFNPDLAGIGGPYPVALVFTDLNGCAGSDTAFFEVVKACNKDFESIRIESGDSLATLGNTITFSVNADESDFQFKWDFPSGCVVVGSQTSNEVTVLWNHTGGTVTLQLVNSCKDTIQKFYEVKTTSVTNEQHCTIFPNPSSGTVNLILSGLDAAQITEIRVTDVSGKVTAKFEIYLSGQQFTLENLSTGLYFVEIRNGNSFLKEKLIVH